MSRLTSFAGALRIAAATLALLTGMADARAQFAITGVAFPGGTPLDVSQYPTVRAQIRTTWKGQPVALGTNTAHIIETNVSFMPEQITYSGNGIHILTWKALRFGFVSCNIMASYEGESASAAFSTAVERTKGAHVVVRDSQSRNVPQFVDFGKVPAGLTDTIKLKVVCTEAAINPSTGEERSILLESVTTSRPEFKVIWKRSFGSSALPTNIISPLEYRIDVVCQPTNDDPLSEVLTVEFEGGMRTTVILVANPASYPRRTILNLVTPNGGETLAPCQTIPITWKGMVPGFKAHVEYTVNNGRSWTAVDSTMDSTLMWRVPEWYSDSVRIRVYQKFEATNSVWLQGPQAQVTCVAYSADSRYLASAYSNGTIVEWDVATGMQAGTYTLAPPASQPVQSMSYLGRTRSIVAALARPGMRGGTVVRFDQGTSGPVVSQTAPTDVTIARIATDVNGAVVYLLPRFSGRIPRFDPATLAAQEPIRLSGTAASSAINGSTISVSMLDGEVVQYNAITGTETGRSQTGIATALGPYSASVATSLTGRLVALAGPQLTGVINAPKEQRTFIYDMQTGRIVKILYREGSEVVNMSFSPSDAYLGLGFQFNPQFVVYDLASARTLPPSGSGAGHSNQLTDIAFGPDGSSVVTSSIDSTNNLLLRRVSVPESDQSDGVFSIAPVTMTVQTIRLRSLLVGTTLDTMVSISVCNTGYVMAVFQGASVIQGNWLALATPIANDTVMPGACLPLRLKATVLDTGLLVDTIRLEACGVTFKVPVEIRGIDRRLSLLTPIENFGDLCVGNRLLKRLAVLRNDDTIGVTINEVFVQGGLGAQFRIAESISDSLIAPGGTLEVAVEFVPVRLGLDTGIVVIRYAGQQRVLRNITLLGRGSGADLQLSHTTLPFMPEITQRQITIRNNSNNTVTIDSATITAGEPFTLLTALPVTIVPGGVVSIGIQYNGGVIGAQAAITFSAQPCAAQTEVKLTAYSATASIYAPRIVADPRSDTTSIPIMATINEPVPYNGPRFVEGLLRLDPRLYLASTITTAQGTATIVSQNVVGPWREIIFRVEGTFQGTMEIARFVGSAGMAAIDSTALLFDTTAVGLGTAVQVQYTNGMLVIQHPDPRRRIINSQYPFAIASIAPVPASFGTTITFDSDAERMVRIVVVDAAGAAVLPEQQATLHSGTTPVELHLSPLPPGLYTVQVESGGYSIRRPLVVVR